MSHPTSDVLSVSRIPSPQSSSLLLAQAFLTRSRARWLPARTSTPMRA
ncbi:hypothetical protein V1478_012290 [Vespula squamosa]|uniref:Uncharacterized protein n=1 Tax=Vespula squamosa TaxID=30214 RepID=A0ABD2ACR5_VESSQ